MKAMMWVCVIVMLGGQIGCQWYEDYRMKKGTADIREETAEMMRAYRMCLQRTRRNRLEQKSIAPRTHNRYERWRLSVSSFR